MTKSTFGDLSTTAASNTSIDGNNTGENCAMSGINNAIRSIGAMGKGMFTFVSTSGSDTYTATLAPAPDALATDFLYCVNFANANTSTTPTLNLNSLGAKTITDITGGALVDGALNGPHFLDYDGTNLRVLNPVKLSYSSGGSVTGPSSSTDAHIAQFSGTTGGVIADSGFTLPSLLRQQLLTGLTLSNNSTTPNTKVDVAGGNCVDDTNTAILAGSSGTINFGTTGANALDTGTIAASTCYHIFIIGKSGGANPAYLASTSLSSPTFPTGYTLKRRIGSVLTDSSSHILAFTQDGDYFRLNASINDISVTNPGTSAVLHSLSVPSGIAVQVFGNAQISGASSGSTAALFSDPAANDETPGSLTSPFGQVGVPSSTSNIAFAQIMVRTNTSQQVRVRLSNSDANVHLLFATQGWIDTRGRFN